MGLDGCIEVGKIPIGQFVSRERILTMLNEIASSQSQLVTLLVDTFDPPTAGALDASALVTSIRAAQSFSNRDFESDDPFAVFSDLDLRAFIETSPLGGRLQRLLDDPGMMFPDMDPFNPNVCERLQNAPTIGAKVEPICSFVNNDLPEFDRLTGTIERVDQINQSLDDLPDLVRFIVEDALPDIDIPTPTPPPAGNTFCQRFPRLCPF